MDVTVNRDVYPYDNKGKVLGLQFTSKGYKVHISDRISLAKIQLGKLYRFKNLSSKNLKKLYTALVRSTLVYPAVVMQAVSSTSLRQMQRVQNKAALLIA